MHTTKSRFLHMRTTKSIFLCMRTIRSRFLGMHTTESIFLRMRTQALLYLLIGLHNVLDVLGAEVVEAVNVLPHQTLHLEVGWH